MALWKIFPEKTKQKKNNNKKALLHTTHVRCLVKTAGQLAETNRQQLLKPPETLQELTHTNTLVL